MDDEALKELAEQYDLAVEAGKAVIVKNWRFFDAQFRAWLINSLHYNVHGRVLSIGLGDDEPLVTELEYHLGTISLCNEVRLSLPRMARGETLPYFVHSARASASYLLVHPHGQEPIFLRLALLAVCKQEKARLLELLPHSLEYGIISGAASMLGRLSLLVLNRVLLIGSPLVLASALTAAAAGKFEETAFACYGLAVTALIFRWKKNFFREDDDSTSSSRERQTFSAWQRLGDHTVGDWTATGAGAKAYLEDMLRRGFNVPLIAIDLCDALTANAFPVSVPVPNKKLEKAEGIYDRASPPSVCEPPAKDDAIKK